MAECKAVVTLLFFPMLILIAYIADKGAILAGAGGSRTKIVVGIGFAGKGKSQKKERLEPPHL